MQQLPVKKLFDEATIPTTATPGSAGLDLYSEVRTTINEGERKLIPTGISMAIPEGMVGLVCPRSGLALNEGITVLNAPGIVDSDYRGQIGVVLINHGSKQVLIDRGERIAQMVFVKFVGMTPHEHDELDETERGDGGYGSTGK